MASTIDHLQVIIGASTDEFEAKLKGLTSSGGAIARIGIAASAAAAAGTAALVGFGVKSIGVGSEFEASMTSVFRNIGDTSEEMEAELTAGVRNIATEYGVSANDIADALAEYAYAGLETADALETVEQATRGAIATGTELSSVITRLDGIYAAFKGQGYEVAEVMDVLTALSSNANGGFDALSDSMVKVAPAAVQAGVSLEQAGAAVGALTWMGVPAAEAGTQVRTMLNELANSGRGVGERFKEITGQTFPEFMAAGGDLREALAILNDNLQEGETLGQLFGSQIAGGAAATIVAGEGAEYYATVLDSLTDSVGATDTAYERMARTIAHKTRTMQAGINELFLTASDHLLPIWGEILDAVNASMPQMQRVVDTVFGSIAEVIRWVTDEVFPALQAGFAGTAESSTIFSRIGEVVRTVADALGFAVDTIAGWLDDLVAGFDQMGVDTSAVWDLVTSVFSTAADVIVGVFQALAALWDNVLKPAWSAMAPFIGAAINSVIEFFNHLFDIISGIVSTLVALFQGDFKGAWESLTGIVETALTGLVPAVLGILGNLATAIVAGLGGIVDHWFDAGGDFVNGLISGITSQFTAAKETITNFGSNVAGWFKDVLGIRSPSTVMIDAGHDIVAGVVQGIEDDAEQAAEAAAEMARLIEERFKVTKNLTSTLMIQLEYGFKTPEEILAELEAIRASLLSQLEELEATGQAGSEAYMLIAQELGVVNSAIDQTNRVIEETGRAAQEAAKEAEAAAERMKRSEDARVQHLRATGQMSLDDYRDILQERLAALEAAGDAETEAAYRLRTEIHNVEQQITADLEAELEERERAAQAHHNNQKRLADNRLAFLVQTGAIDAQTYLGVLEQKMAGEERFSDEWMSLWREAEALRQQLADEAAAEEEQRRQEALDAERKAADRAAQIAANQYAEERRLGKVSTADHLKSLKERLKAIEDAGDMYTDEWAEVNAEILAIEQETRNQQQAYEQSLYDFKRYTGQIGLQEHITNLHRELENDRLTAEQKLALERQLFDAEAQLRNQTRAEEEALVQHQLRMGEMSTAQYLDYLKQKLDSEETTAVERRKILEEIHGIEQQQVAAREALDERYYAFARRRGEVSLEEHIANLQAKLSNEELTAEERLSIEVELYDAQEELAKNQTELEKKQLEQREKAHKDFLSKVFQGVDAFRGILGQLGLDGDSAWGKLLDGAINFAKAITSGDWVGAIASAISTIIGLIGDMANGIKEGQAAIEDAQKRLRWADAEAFGDWTRVSRGGILGFFGATKAAWNVDEMAMDIAVALERGVTQGLTKGMKAFLSGESDDLFGLISDEIRSAIEDAIIEGVLNSAILQGALGGLIENITKAIATGDEDALRISLNELREKLPDIVDNIESGLIPLRELLTDVFTYEVATPLPNDAGMSGLMGSLGIGSSNLVGSYLNMSGVSGANDFNQQINVHLDGRVLASATAANLPGILHIAGVNY